MKQEVISDNAPKPIGPYSQGVNIGNMLFLSGQIAISPQTGTLITSNLEEEVQLVLNNIEALLDSSGYLKEHIVKVSIFMKDLTQFDILNTIYANFFVNVNVFPARETVEVSRLPKNVNVEMSVIAIKQ